MAKRSVEHQFIGETVSHSNYDSTKTVLGNLIVQKTGELPTDKYAGPFPVSMARPMEASTAIPGQYPHILVINNTYDWVFLADLAAVAATRRVVMYKYNKITHTLSWQGFIVLTYPTTGNVTLRAIRVVRHLYTTGTVGVSDTAVTGSGTAWETARYAAGARIGFGSTNPDNITTWYYIASIDSDTGITLGGSAGTISAGTSFVIEELRVYSVNTNATPANGGLFVAKGINVDDFAAGGTIIAAASTTDNVKAVYWLADAATVTNTAGGSLALQPNYTDTSHIMYITNSDSTSVLRVFKYDGRAALNSLASGKSTEAFLYKTGQATALATLSQTNAGRLETCQHGPGAGVSSLYTVSTTRIWRMAEAGIVEGSTSFITDSMSEIPTGGTGTYAVTNAISSIEYMGTIDRFVITTGSGQRHYVTKYLTDGSEFDHVLFTDNKQIDQTTADGGTIPFPSTTGAGFSCRVENGIGYFARVGATVLLNQLYVLPLGAHWDYAASSNNRLITPSLSTTGASKFYRLYVNHEKYLGSDNLGIQVEPYRVFFRTSGIEDNSGSWTSINSSGDLSSITPADEIQFMFEFKTIGTTCLPAKIYSVNLVYEDHTTDSHYQPSVGQSSIGNKRFAWRFSTAFGGTVPTLTIRLYNSESGLLLTDTTAAAALGTFQKSTDDGETWGAYDTTDKANETTYIRYTPTNLADNIKVRALLTQN